MSEDKKSGEETNKNTPQEKPITFKGKFKPLLKESDNDKKLNIVRQAKALNIQAYAYGLEQLRLAGQKVQNIQNEPSKSNGKDLFEAKIDLALAQTELDIFEKMYAEDFGEPMPKL